jgi:hypothetical protein
VKECAGIQRPESRHISYIKILKISKESKVQDAFAENIENYKVLQGHKNM